MKLTKRLGTLLPASVTQRLKGVPMGPRLARSALWTLAGGIAAKVLNLPVSVLLARLMGPGHYGELGIVNNSVDLFIVFAGFGLGLTATKYVAELRGRDPVRAGRILALSNVTAVLTGGCFSVAFFLMAPWMASHILSAPQLTGALRIGALILFVVALTGAQGGALYGYEAFKVSAQLQTIVALLTMILMISGYLLGRLEGILYGVLLAKTIDWLLRHIALRAEARRAGISVVYADCIRELPVLWRFSLPAVMAGALVAPVNWICSAMLVNRPHGYEEMGAYSAANQWYGALLFLPVVLGTGLLPLFSDRLGNGDVITSGKVLSFMLRLNAIIVLPCALGLTVLSPYVMRAYGHGFSQAWPTLVVVAATAAIYAVLAPVADVIAASGRMWLGFAMNAGWALIFIFGTRLSVGWGSLGLASARLVAYAVHATWTLVFAHAVMNQSTGKCSLQAAPARP